MYNSNNELPESIKNNLPLKAQSIWREIFNNAYKEYRDDKKSCEVAWSGLEKAGWEKENDRWVEK